MRNSLANPAETTHPGKDQKLIGPAQGGGVFGISLYGD